MFGPSWVSLPDVAADGQPKSTPPKATPKVLPRPLILKPARVTFHKNDSLIVKYICTRFKVTELHNLEEKDLRKLNISSTNFLPLVEILPKEYIPPSSWIFDPQGSADPSKPFERPEYVAVLSNGTRRPDHQKFYGFAKELLANLSTVYRSLRRDAPPQGFENIKILHFRKFWIALHNVGRYWDDSLDTPEKTAEGKVEEDKHVKPSADEIVPDDADIDVDSIQSDDDSIAEPSVDNNYTYTGRRTSTGSQMESIMSLNLAEAFLEPIMYAFGCYFDQVSQGAHDLFFVNSVATCLHTKLIFSKPKDLTLTRQGVLEGPIAVLHAHASVEFGPDTNGETGHFIRELKAILLCAQQRSRENEQHFHPGGGEWWGLARGKWGHALDNGVGGLPGEAVGAPLTDRDLFPKDPSLSSRPVSTPTTALHTNGKPKQDLAIIECSTEKEPEYSTYRHSNGRLHESPLDEDIIVLDTVTGPAKVAPLTGDELKFRLMESTLAYPYHSEASENNVNSLSESNSGSDAVSTTLNTPDLATKKKRSFGTFASHGNSHTAEEDTIPIDYETIIVLDKDTQPAELARNSGVIDTSTSLSKSISKSQDLSHEDRETSKSEWYKSMLENLSKKSESEQKARRTAIKMANQPARNPFHSPRKNLKRIGMHPLASHDEIYLISVLNHHISFVHLRIDHKFMDWLSPNPRERARVASLKKDTSTWWGIPLRRSRWYDLFDEQDRIEALRATWAIFGKLMADANSNREVGV